MDRTGIDELLRKLLADISDKNGTVKTIQKIIKNILDHPTDSKYRRLKVSCTRFTLMVVSTVCFQMLLTFLI